MNLEICFAKNEGRKEGGERKKVNQGWLLLLLRRDTTKTKLCLRFKKKEKERRKIRDTTDML